MLESESCKEQIELYGNIENWMEDIEYGMEDIGRFMDDIVKQRWKT